MMVSSDIFAEICAARAEGKAFAIATLVAASGSTPRRAGARMLVFPDGTISGTIGGGNFEKMVIDDARGLLASGRATMLKSYRFEESGPDATGMYCGGEGQVFFEGSGAPERLVIFGGGHVGRDLARVAAGLNFRIIVVDERTDILAQYAAPVKTRLTDAEYQTNYPDIDDKTYAVIVTHGHRCDKQVLAKIINGNCAYIGMIGSKAKIARTFRELEESGIPREALSRVRSPIGLDIGAEGPYEIAVAIAAELVAVRRKKNLAAG